MKKLILSLLVLLMVSISVSIGQPIYTKDMVNLGSKDDVMRDCLGSTDQNYIYVNERIINKHFYCRCVIAELIPKIRFAELKQAIESNKLDELFLQKKYFKVIDPCMKYYAEIENAYSFDRFETTEKDKQLYIDICKENFDSKSFPTDTISPETIEDYCECTVNTMIGNGYSLDQIFEMDKDDSEVFNEVLITCFSETLEHLLMPEMRTGYNPDDIHGSQLVSHVKLIDYLGMGYKVKISIGGVTKYFVFDTGASFLAIDSELEHELLSSGAITSDSYFGMEELELANKVVLEARKLLLNDMTIGDFTVDNVMAVVIDDGALLCGTSLLNKFKKWEIDTEGKSLILYR